MYNDKDFQNKSSYLKSNREETTGLSGRVQDEYQLSDLDFQIHNNTHTFNLSNSNQLSFNDSCQVHESTVNNNDNRESYYSNNNRESGYWKKGRDSAMQNRQSFVC